MSHVQYIILNMQNYLSSDLCTLTHELVMMDCFKIDLLKSLTISGLVDITNILVFKPSPV